MRQYLTAAIIALYSLFLVPSVCVAGVLHYCCEHGHERGGQYVQGQYVQGQCTHGQCTHGQCTHEGGTHEGVCEHHDCSSHDTCSLFARWDDDEVGVDALARPVASMHVLASLWAPKLARPRKWVATEPVPPDSRNLPYPPSDLPLRR